MKKRKLSIVIPCYNAENLIDIVINKLLNYMNKQKEYEFEVVLVNDGSIDNTWEAIKRLAENYANVISINFSKNFGQHHALMAAYRSASGDIIVGMDDDGEHRVEDIIKLVNKIDEGYDYVCADYERGKSKFRNFGTAVNNLMATYLIDKPKEVEFSSFYAMRRFVVEEIIRYQQPFPYIGGLLLRTTKNIASVKLEKDSRISGHSGYTMRKMLKLWLNGFTAFSIKPLHIATSFGMIVSVIGFIMTFILIIKKIFFVDLALGYTSLMTCIIVFSGIIMILLGVIGEYLGRIYMSINGEPQYVISEKIDQRMDNEDER